MVSTAVGSGTAAVPKLRRVLSFWALIFYGMGVIVGAGIYVALGAVMARAGPAAPVSFLLAGIVASMTGLCYAEFSGRFPEAAGAASYVGHGFRSDRLAMLVGAATTIAVAISAASIARGAIQYLAELLPLSVPVLTTGLVVGFTAVAMIGVRESVGLAASNGALEILGLAAAAAAGLLSAPDYSIAGMIPLDGPAWRGVVAGAFIAFFAFIGFETLANMAEEVKDPHRTVPRGIIGAIAASLVLYLIVAISAVLSDQGGRNPLLGLFQGNGKLVFAAIGFLSVANGVLIEIVMLARLFYGMAGKGQLPRPLARVHPWTRTPLLATLAGGAIVLAAALLVPFEHLLVAANAVTLGIFFLVDVALWLVHRRETARPAGFSVPRWIPPVAALLTVALIVGELMG
jgi:amino acid transporter